MYFSLMLARISASRIRLIVSGIIGAGTACITVLFNMRPVFYILNLILTFFLMVLITAGSVTMLKRFKVYVAFIVIETLLGGLITYLYGALDKYFAPIFDGEEAGVENRQLLFFAMLVLLSIGFLKLVFSLFSGALTERSVDLIFTLLGSVVRASALVDSGNLLKDPMTMMPVVLLKSRVLGGILTEFSTDLMYTADERLRGMLRLIPVKGVGGTRILVGLKTRLNIKYGKNEYAIDAVVAIDEEEGSFGGYDALMPSELIG